MKRILILLLALMPVIASAQTLTIDKENQSVTWSHIFQSTLTQDEILNQILAYGLLDNVVTHGDMIAGDIRPVYLNYQAAGYGRMKVALYLSNGTFNGRMILRFKEGRYKAEALNMYFEDSTSRIDLYGGVGEFAFDITQKLIIEHLTKIATFVPIDNEW